MFFASALLIVAIGAGIKLEKIDKQSALILVLSVSSVVGVVKLFGWQPFHVWCTGIVGLAGFVLLIMVVGDFNPYRRW